MMRNLFRGLFSGHKVEDTPFPPFSVNSAHDQNDLESVKVAKAIGRAQTWLEKNKQTFAAETENGITFKDNFVNLLILELSKRWYVSKSVMIAGWHDSYHDVLDYLHEGCLTRRLEADLLSFRDYVDLRIPPRRRNYFGGR